MEIIIAILTMIFTALSFITFLRSEMKKSRDIFMKREVEIEQRLSTLESKQSAINETVNRIERDLSQLRFLFIKGGEV